MKKLVGFVTIVALFSITFTGCNADKKVKKSEQLKYNQYVDAFTSGAVPRKSSIYLVLNEDIPADKQSPEEIRKHVRIQPSVEGDFYVEQNRTIVFTPKEELKRDEIYEVKADLSKWIGKAQGEDRAFAFQFSTLPFALQSHLNTLDINSSNDKHYDVTCTFLTPDQESPETIEALIKCSEEVSPQWTHSPNGRKHIVTLRGISSKEKSRTLSFFAGSNQLKVDVKSELLAVSIPGLNEFGVYGVDYKVDPERFIEVTFTKTLDASQDMKGLVYLQDYDGESRITVEGNKLRLYAGDITGTIKVQVSEGIRSKDRATLAAGGVYEVNVGADYPNINFVGKGVVIPASEQLSVPFQAIHVRGVVVRVLKIREQNIGQFLQVNQLDGSSQLKRVGRLILRKTIFLDDDPQTDLSKLNTYAIDLGKLIEVEPGAIYRIDLSINPQLSTYSCPDSEIVPKSKEQLLAEDQEKFQQELSGFDGNSNYYYDDYYEYGDDGYGYEQYNFFQYSPCAEDYYGNSEVNVARNVMASNLGIIAMAGDTKSLTAVVHNLITARPESGVEVRLFNYQHQQIGSAKSDDAGYVTITYESGRPFYLIAAQGAQRSYLLVKNSQALSFSTFDVSGEVVQKGIKGFIYGERGVWRPGDTIHLGFMINDRVGDFPSNHPVVMELHNPLGQLYQTRTSTLSQHGLYTFKLVTEPDAPTGAWNITAKAGGVTFTKRIRIESIKPNRLKIEMKIKDPVLLRSTSSEADLHVEWLQGATARDLKYEVSGTFASIPTRFQGYDNYTFDDPSKKFDTEEGNLISGVTDDAGNAQVGLRFDAGSSAPGMLAGNLVIRAFEPSGDFSIDAFRVQYSPFSRYAGIQAPSPDRDGHLFTDKNYTYNVVSLDHNGKPLGNTALEVEVFKVYWYWWWSSNYSNLANYISDSYRGSTRLFSVTTNSNGVGTFDLKIANGDWGTYFIRVTDPATQHSSGMMSYFDWSSYAGRRDMEGTTDPTLLSFKTDKERYKPGDKMLVTLPSSAGSRAIVSVLNGSKILFTKGFDCADKETTLKLDITAEMMPNAYVHVTLIQPYEGSHNDLPLRLYGVVPILVNSDESLLTPVITMADEIKPESKYEVTVSEKSGREMAYTLAIVDEGLLDLTRFKTPDPWSVFNAREALGVNTWDMYNYVVGAYGGRIEQLFSIGGDEALNKGPKAIVNRFKPVVRFEGPFLLKKGAKMRHNYDMPNYMGRVRVMVVAADGKAFGNAQKSVLVRKPVMILGTLPRVIGVGEQMMVPATVFAMKDNVGEVNVTISCSDNLEIVGGASQKLNFSKQEDKQAAFWIKVKNREGKAHVKLTAVNNGQTSTYETDIEIRSVRTPQVRITNLVVEPGKEWKQTVEMPGADGTNKLTLEVSTLEPLDISRRLSYLLGYPHGCLEQITSKAFPQLYVKDFAELTPEQLSAATATVKEVINRLRSYQVADGGFAYWPGNSNVNAWGTVYAAHFLTEAEAQGYVVPSALKNSLLANLKRTAREWKASSSYYRSSEEQTQAYRLYVLSRAQISEIGAMNRLKEQADLATMSRWMLAGAYLKAGRKDVAETLLDRTTALNNGAYNEYDFTYGSVTRDDAIILQVLCELGRMSEAVVVAKRITTAFADASWLSTQTSAFGLMAMADFMKKNQSHGPMEFTYRCDAAKETVSNSKAIWSKDLINHGAPNAAMEVKNTGKASLFVRIIAQGTPDLGYEKALESRISVSVQFVDLSGNPIRVDTLSQGTNFTSIVTVKNPSTSNYTNIALTQVFPAGWEILNTRFAHEDTVDTYPDGVSFQDIRDDRVYSYMDYLPYSRHVTLRVNLCAIYPGTYFLPPVSVAAMYNNEIRANTEGYRVNVR